MKKKTISIVLSTLCTICIGVFAPFSVHADLPIDLEWDSKDGLQIIFDAPDVAATLINKLRDTAINDTYTAPEMRFISGSRAIEYTSNGLNTRAWTLRVYCYYVGSESMFNGLTFKDKATNRDLQVNNIYIDYVDNSGSIRHYCIKPNYLNFSLTWRGYCDLGFTGGTYTLDDGLEFPLDNYSHNFRLLSDFNINNYNYRVNFPDIKGVYYNNYENPTFYPAFDNICYNTYYFRYGENSDYYDSIYPDFFMDNFTTNNEEDNYNIDNKDTGIYNYYYNTEFKQGNTYNYNDTEYKVQRMQNDIDYKFKDLLPPVVTTTNTSGGGGWVSPDYPTITVSAVLEPSIVEFSTVDIPSNLMEVGTSFLSKSLEVVDTIPYFMLSLNIIFMVWVCFHIFGK